MYVEECRPERKHGEQLRGYDGPADLKQTEGQGRTERKPWIRPNYNNKGCENNWVRKIARVKRADRRIMVELREEAGVQG